MLLFHMVLFKAVHLGQDLVERLLPLFVGIQPAATAPQRVNLVDEDDRRRRLPRALPQVPHARGPAADERLDELGRGREEERHRGFRGERAGEHRLAGSRGAREEHPPRHARAHGVEAGTVAQELHQLRQLLLRPIDARDVRKRHALPPVSPVVVRIILSGGRAIAAATAAADASIAEASHLHHPRYSATSSYHLCGLCGVDLLPAPPNRSGFACDEQTYAGEEKYGYEHALCARFHALVPRAPN